MNKTRYLKTVSVLLCILLIAATAFFTSACSDRSVFQKETTSETGSVKSDAPKEVLGTGATVFSFTVTGADGAKTPFEIHTDAQTVGDALLSLGLISGDESAYGLYVKTVNGVTLDYEKDGMYWSFYANGVYATEGVDKTKIETGASYGFKAEKA